MITFSVEGVAKTAARLQKESEDRRKAIQRSMAGITVSMQRAVKDKLNGPVLHVKTGNLRNSVHEEVTIQGDVVTGSVFTTLAQGGHGKYAAVHEYGGTFNIPAHKRRVAFDRGGDRVKRKSKKAYLVEEVTVRAHTATYPERSYMRSTLKESKTRILESLSKAAKHAVTEAGQ